MLKTNYSKNQSKKLNYTNIKLDKIQELISESSVLLKKNFISHLNPTLLIQNLRQFVKLIGSIKKEHEDKLKDPTQIIVGKPILLYSENKHTRYLLQIMIRKLEKLLNVNVGSLIEIGGIKQLLTCVELNNKDVLIIFIEKPYKTNIEFCTNHNVYMLCMFLNDLNDNSKIDYKIPLTVNTLKRYFWLVTFIVLI